MLAQGQPSSAKRGGLAADVSSWLIFLKRKKKNLKQFTKFTSYMLVFTITRGKKNQSKPKLGKKIKPPNSKDLVTFL